MPERPQYHQEQAGPGPRPHVAGWAGLTAVSGTVGELVAAYLAEQCEVLASNDVGMRTGTPAVHKTRVAARRLRSTLRIFSDVFEAEPAEELDNELKWYADVLGQVRDRDILSSRLGKQIADLPPEQVRGPVEAEVTKTLDAEREDAVRTLDKAMRTPRYAHLVQLLRGWRATPPLTDAAGEKGAAAVEYVEKAQRRADKRLRKADDDIEPAASGPEGVQTGAVRR